MLQLSSKRVRRKKNTLTHAKNTRTSSECLRHLLGTPIGMLEWLRNQGCQCRKEHVGANTSCDVQDTRSKHLQAREYSIFALAFLQVKMTNKPCPNGISPTLISLIGRLHIENTVLLLFWQEHPSTASLGAYAGGKCFGEGGCC